MSSINLIELKNGKESMRFAEYQYAQDIQTDDINIYALSNHGYQSKIKSFQFSPSVHDILIY